MREREGTMTDTGTEAVDDGAFDVVCGTDGNAVTDASTASGLLRVVDERPRRMSTSPSFDDIFAAMSAAAAGDRTVRVAVPDDPQLDDVTTRFALGLNVLLDDLSSRMSAAERMRESYRSMFESSPQPMYVLDLSTLQFLEVNDAAVRQYGYTREELRTMTAADLWPTEDAEKNREAASRPLPLYGVLMRHRKKDGSLRWVDVRVNALTFDGRASRLVLVNDVTQRVADEEGRRAAEARFARLADSGILGIIVTNLDGRVLETNGALVDLVGYSHEELVSGRVRWSDLTPDEWRSTDQRAIEQLTSAGVASLREKEYVRHDGSRVPVLVGSAMLEGTSRDCISFVLDLRGRKEAAAAVEHLREARASEAMFRAFVEAAPDAVVIAGRDGKIVLVNSQTERLYGYTRDELVGQPTEMLTAQGFRAQFSGRLAGYFADGPAAVSGSREVYGRRKDGSEFPIEFTVGLLETAGGTLVCGSIRDTTERKKAEEVRFRLAALVEACDDAIIGKTVEGIITSWNGGAQRLFGYSAQEMIGRPLTVLIPSDGQKEEPESPKQAGGQVERFDAVRLHKDGHELHVSVTTSPVRDSAGKLIGASKVVRDITERRRAEVALAHARDRAEAANRELEAFSYSVAHDLRAPLRGMSGFAQVLIDTYQDKLDADGKDWLEEIILNARKMGALIDGLLALARLTRSELRREPVDLSSVARAAVRQLSTAEPDRAVEMVIQQGLDAEVDPPLVQAVLENLLGNAWKFTEKVSAARVEFGSTERDGVRTFFVRDNGAGFDMAFAGKLFAPFQRLHTVDEFPGTGIGLATVQRIVHRHGGRIWAEGAVDGGATFYFTFPARAWGATS
jgi:PAS domain S-box-containing protein